MDSDYLSAILTSISGSRQRVIEDGTTPTGVAEEGGLLGLF